MIAENACNSFKNVRTSLHDFFSGNLNELKLAWLNFFHKYF